MNENAGKLEYRMVPKDELYKEALAVAGRNDGTILLRVTDYGLILLHPN
jgi:hypothetical protein